MMLLLLFLYFAANLRGTDTLDESTRPPISKFLTKKAFKDISASAKLLTTYIPNDSLKTMLSIAFDAPSAFDSSADAANAAAIEQIQLQVEEIGYDITNALLEASDICEGLEMEEISIRAAALLNLWIQAEFGLWMDDTVFVDLFLKACDQTNKLLYELHRVSHIISMDKNPLETAIAADTFYKYRTIDQARLRIVQTANILAFVEANRAHYSNEADQHLLNDVLLEILNSISNRTDQIVADSEGKTTYFKNKVPAMINKIFEELKNENDQSKAEALMNALTEIHTKDRFVVIVYNEDCRLATIVNAVEKNTIFKDEHRLIVYRSQNAFNMTAHVEDESLTVLKSPKKPFSCSELGALNITKAASHSGLILVEKCPMVIAQDNRFALQKHTVECLTIGGNPMNITNNVYSYPF